MKHLDQLIVGRKGVRKHVVDATRDNVRTLAVQRQRVQRTEHRKTIPSADLRSADEHSPECRDEEVHARERHQIECDFVEVDIERPFKSHRASQVRQHMRRDSVLTNHT